MIEEGNAAETHKHTDSNTQKSSSDANPMLTNKII